MLQIILTFVFIAIGMFFVIKNWYAPVALIFVTIIGLGIFTLVTGNSVLGDKTVGSGFLDLFELITQKAGSVLGSNALTPLFMMGYVQYMETIGANKRFTVLLAAPLKKIKNKYFLCACLILIGALIKIVVPTGISSVALIIATLYPVLRAVGCSKESVASAAVISATVAWGPADGGVNLAVALAGLPISSAELFVQYQIPIVLIVIAAFMLGFMLTAKYFDKKEGALAIEEGANLADADVSGTPKYYAFFPLMPLILILIFSKLIVKTIVITPTAATFISFMFVMLARILTNMSKAKDTFNEAKQFCEGMTSWVRNAGFLMISGTLFAAAINTLGGIQILISTLNAAGGSFLLLVIIGAILGAVCSAATGTFSANFNVVVPFFVSVATVTGHDLAPLMVIALSTVGGGMCLSPVGSPMLLMCGTVNVSVPTVIKRNVVPFVFGVIALLVSTFVIYY